ncbi:MAG: hypothetical protein RJA22_261 [Verrucomicrobiota bacterium]|jgi:hypothetical protein
MSESFELENPEGAKDFLRGHPKAIQQRGEEYFRRGAVESLQCVVPGSSYRAVVQGTQPYTVELFQAEGGVWDAKCACPMEVDCKHGYAAMKALLAEHNLARVQQLSAAPAKAAAPGQPRRTAQAKRGPLPLPDLLAEGLGRALEPAERKLVQRIQALFERAGRNHRVTAWDLRELGFNPPGDAWGEVDLWPSPPVSAHEFWLYVALAAEGWGQPIPDFMRPITDLAGVRDRVQRWRREEQVKRWQHTLTTLQATPAVAPEDVDLRLHLGPNEACVFWRRPGRADFVLLKQAPSRQLAADWEAGRVNLPPEAETLWQAMMGQLNRRGRLDLGYYDANNLEFLARLARQPLLRGRMMTEDGRPLTWVPEPLRWELRAPAEGGEDYVLRLVRADGTPPPRGWVALPGNPSFLLCGDTVYTAPATVDAVPLDLGEHAIPAKALETPGGLDLLRRLGVEAPAVLRERMRIVPVRIRIRCAIEASRQGAGPEFCSLRLLAASEDGELQERWSGERWVEDTKVGASYGVVTSVPRRPRRRADGAVYYDRSAQAGAERLVAALEPRWDTWLGHGTVRITKKFPELFVTWLQSLPKEVAVDLDSELQSLTQAPVAGSVRLDVSEAGIDWFDLRVVLDVADTTLTQAELKLLLNARGGYVRLAGKGWRRLQFNLSDQEDEQLARLGLNPRELTDEPQRLHALQLADAAARKFLPEAQFESVQRRAAEIQARVTPDLPAAIQAELRPYQLEGFHFLAYLSKNNFGGILADDMGLGKTLQTLSWLAWLRAEAAAAARGKSPLPPSLVVCPKSVTDNWRAEAARFVPGLRVKVWGAGELESMPEHLRDADLHVLNYAQLRTLGDALAAARWLAVILDEGQYIKNPSSQTAEVARTLQAAHRLVLTGTPIENRLLDLWSLMSFAMPGALGTRAGFGRLFDAKEDPFARRRLAARVRPFLLRRTKAQVAKDLPDRIEEDLFCEMEGAQKILYRAELKRAQQMLLRVQTQKQLNTERFNLLTSLLRLRQVCCHPRLVQDSVRSPGAKLEALLEQLEPLMEEGHKVLVFSQFVSMLDLLREALAEKGWPLFYLAGDTENRGELVQQFQGAEGAAIFLISLKAGGFGLNLTAASYVVLFDPWWNPAVENQAIDRTHRIGQSRKVIAYRLLIKDSIEEKIRALQRQKKALAEDVLGEEKFAQALTLDDLRFLFAD